MKILRLNFQALVQDQTNPPDTLLISWTSSVDGKLNIEPPDSQGSINFDYDALSAGEINAFKTNISGFSTSALTNIWILSMSKNR